MARKSGSSSKKAATRSASASTEAATAPTEQQQQQQQQAPALRSTFAFFHPDLGIGGAERLVVDAAVGLKERGFNVVIFTNHCDPNHCFEECRDGTLDVRVRASFPIPMSIFGRFTILCAILRHFQLLLTLTITRELKKLKPRALIVDQLSAGLPYMYYMYPDAPILFYCHFPDLYLAQGRDASLLKRIYRAPFDFLEGWSMGFARSIAVNSNFTKAVVRKTWPLLGRKAPVGVVYPCVPMDDGSAGVDPDEVLGPALRDDKIILSINRFERKKDIDLAIKAFAAIPAAQRDGVRLVIAGGYDARIAENVQYLSELESLASSLSLGHATITPDGSLSEAPPASEAPVLFLPSVPGPSKTALLSAARLLVYTPAAEHFGIVPLEAMRARVPVLAATTGGPVESVEDGVTGWLRDTTDIPAWTEVMVSTLQLSEKQVAQIGTAGAKRVRELFSRDSMAKLLDMVIGEMIHRNTLNPDTFLLDIIIFVVVLGAAFIIGIAAAQGYAPVKKVLVGDLW